MKCVIDMGNTSPLGRLGNLLALTRGTLDPLASIVRLPPRCQIEWADYLNLLAPEDAANVLEFTERVTLHSRLTRRPLALMAVGSVLNKAHLAYGDVDLLLLPVDYTGFGTADRLADFVRDQPEIVCEKEGALPLEDVWSTNFGYDTSRHWHLLFAKGRSLNIFVGVGEWDLTLYWKLVNEASEENTLRRKFAYTVAWG